LVVVIYLYWSGTVVNSDADFRYSFVSALKEKSLKYSPELALSLMFKYNLFF